MEEVDRKHLVLIDMERFIDKYLPIRIQYQISESLNSCLNRTMLYRLKGFELIKYKSLNEAVLEEAGADFKKGMSSTMDKLESMFQGMKSDKRFKRQVRESLKVGM